MDGRWFFVSSSWSRQETVISTLFAAARSMGQWWSFIEKFLIKRNHCIFTSQQQLPEREEECRRVIEMEYRTKKWLNVKWLQFFKSERTEWQRKVTECESRNCDLGNNGILVKRITTIIIIIISRYIGICFLLRGCSTCFELYDRSSSVTSLRRCRCRRCAEC